MRATELRIANPMLNASRQVWLAGLGAAVVTREWAQSEAGNVFRSLVKEGTIVESRTIRMVGNRLESTSRRMLEPCTTPFAAAPGRGSSQALNAPRRAHTFARWVSTRPGWTVRSSASSRPGRRRCPATSISSGWLRASATA